MPLFMGVCGFFFAKSIVRVGRRAYIKEKLKVRLLGLIVPMLSFGILKSIISQDMGVISYLRNVHNIWFLGDLAINTILVLIVTKFSDGSFIHDIKLFL